MYVLLLEALAVEIPAQERTKPPCRDEFGAPPVDADLAEAGSGRVRPSCTTTPPPVDRRPTAHKREA